MNNIKILKNYILYFLTFLLICIVGISGIFAETLENIGYLDNYTDVLVEVSYNGQPLPLTRTDNYQLSSVEAININVSNFTFNAGVTYVLEFYTPNTTLDYANVFTLIGNDNNNNTVSCSTSDISYHDTYYLTLKFNCSSNVNYISARVYNSQGNYIMDSGIFSWNYLYLRRVASGTDLSIIESQNAQIIQGQQDIINSQNANTDKEIESQKVCSNKQTVINETNKDNFNIGWLSSNNTVQNNSSFRYSDYIKINKDDVISITRNMQSGNVNAYCIYNSSKTLISCTEYGTSLLIQYTVTQDGFVRFSGSIEGNTSTSLSIKSCVNGNQALNDSINDDDSSGASSEASEFFSSFTTNTFGLTSIITAPLNLIQSLTSSTCSSLHLPLPYLDNKYLDLPCMTSIYSQYFGSFFTIYQTITYGIIAYWVCVRIFNQVKDFKNPEHDEIEVVDL